MKKNKLLQLINSKQLKKSNVLSIYLLKRFLETQPIQELKKDDKISFRDYLTFLQKDFPNVIDLFKEPYLKIDNKKEIKLLDEFIDAEKIPTSIVSNNIFVNKFNEIRFINESASTLTIMPDGNILSGTCYSDSYGAVHGKINLRDPYGNFIRKLANEPASTLTIMPDGNILSGTCYSDSYGTVHGKISFIKPTLVERKKKLILGETLLLQKINELLLDKTTLACIQFHKGTVMPTNDVSMLCTMPRDILNIIYSYVFTFPNAKTNIILNPNCFPNPTEKDIKEISLANEFAKKILKVKFFSQPRSRVENNVVNDDQIENQKHSKNCNIM